MKTPPTNMLNNSKNEAPIKIGMNSYALEYGLSIINLNTIGIAANIIKQIKEHNIKTLLITFEK